MKLIVVGMDASEAAGAALRWAASVANATDAELIVVHAFTPSQAELPPGRLETMRAEHKGDLAGWVKGAGNVPPTIEVRDGDARAVLRDLMIEQTPDLVVVGRLGTTSDPGFLHLGSVAEYLGHHAVSPLAVIPADAPAGIRRIAIGVDGSDTSIAAVAWCAPLAAAMGSSVTAVCAAEPVLQWPPEGTPLSWVERTQAKLTGEWTAPLAAAGVTVEAQYVPDMHPADALLDAVSDEGADLLVVGMRGLGGFTGLRAGGVALRVLHQARVPLVLVPPR